MPKKILVVEDEGSIRRIIRAFLEEAGYSVEMAGDGVEGVAKFRHASEGGRVRRVRDHPVGKRRPHHNAHCAR